MCGTLELVRLDVGELGVDRHHRVVHPHVDRAEGLLDGGRGRLDGGRVGDVAGQDESLSAASLDLALCLLEAGPAARDQADPRAVLAEAPRGRAADAGEAPVMTTTSLTSAPGPRRHPRRRSEPGA